MKFLDQPRFAEARLADDEHQLALALTRTLPAPHQHGNFLIAADERGEIALTGTAAAATGANKPEQRRRFGHALERVRAALFCHKQPGDLTLHLRRDQDRARLGQRLHARGNVGDVSIDFPAASRTAGPDSRPMRATSSGLAVPAFLRLSSAKARWIDSAARAARSASFSCACGQPNRHINPYPISST